jgi:choline dehydrogenase-like flavoprotein
MDASRIVREPEDTIVTDVLVIGTGPGGAIVSALLAERGIGVLAVEEGPILPLSSCRPFSSEELLQKYRGGGLTVTLPGPRIVFGEGRCVGGGSEVNSALYHRLPPEVLDEWVTRYRLDAVRVGEMAAHATAVEEETGLAQPAGDLPGASRMLRDGARALGWRSLEVPRLASAEPSSSLGEGRRSMTVTHLPRALAAGALLLPDARVRRLRREAGRWRALVDHRPTGRTPRRIDVIASRVVVCGGAVQTPALLRRSGITRRVGNTLRLQTMVKVVARFPGRINGDISGVAAHQVKEFAPRFSLGCSVSTRPHLAMAMVDHGEHLAAAAEAWEHMAVFYAVGRGGVGSVRPLPGCRDPLVRYRLAPEDLGDLGDGMRALARLLLRAGAVVVYPGIAGAKPITDEAGVADLPRVLPVDRTAMLSFHLVGSCPMGEDRSRCAVDSFGHVHGVEGVVVADGSILCEAPGVNPQGTIMALARRAALHLAGAL